MLARLGRDPWAEAARWAALPRAAVIDDLVETIAQMPLASPALAATCAIAVRLAGLPAGEEKGRSAGKRGRDRNPVPVAQMAADDDRLWRSRPRTRAERASDARAVRPAPRPSLGSNQRPGGRIATLTGAGSRFRRDFAASAVRASCLGRPHAASGRPPLARENTVVPILCGSPWAQSSASAYSPKIRVRRSGNAETGENRPFHQIQHHREHASGDQRRCHDSRRKRHHGNAERQGTSDRHVNQGRPDQPPAGTDAPQMRTAADCVDHCLAAENQRDEGQCLQRRRRETQREAPTANTAQQNTSSLLQVPRRRWSACRYAMRSVPARRGRCPW